MSKHPDVWTVRRYKLRVTEYRLSKEVLDRGRWVLTRQGVDNSNQEVIPRPFLYGAKLICGPEWAVGDTDDTDTDTRILEHLLT